MGKVRASIATQYSAKSFRRGSARVCGLRQLRHIGAWNTRAAAVALTIDDLGYATRHACTLAAEVRIHHGYSVSSPTAS